MRLGILLCDDVPESLSDHFHNYPDMFEEALRAVMPDLCLQTFRVHDNEFPDSIDQCQSWLISGSCQSVYQGDAWIEHLKDFIRQLYRERKKLVGVCFGHQVIAAALGGEVELSPKGWGVGLAANDIDARQSWMSPEAQQFRIIVSYQDQVSVLPADTKVLASSEFCPYFLLQYGETFLSTQGHPEYTKDYITALMNDRKGHVIPDDLVARGNASLLDEDDHRLMNVWIANFLNSV